jgi:Carboxypeptidase regulatory-like domain
MRFSSRITVLLLCCTAAFAQSDRGTITGEISDPAGAVVAGALVEAKNAASGAVFQAASTNTGNYTLSQLPAGDYDLTVAVAGFKKYVRPNITVQVAGTLRIDVSLEVGSASESVTVTEAAPLLKTESGELSHNMTTDRVDSLPLINLGYGSGVGNVRNPLQAINLVPGSAFANDNTLRVNGLPANTQSIRIEGQDATNGQHREFNQVNQASLDAIQEVSVQVSNYAAEYGQAGGGYFNYTMKSGTNQLHGSAYDYFVNEVLNAGTPFTDAGVSNSLKEGQHIRNAQRRNDFGFSLGGPVKIPKLYNGHDRTFFFFNFEQFRENQVITSGLTTVPTLAYRQGDFSKALINPLTIGGQPAIDSAGQALVQNEIFDPTSTRVAADGSSYRLPFTNNTIPNTAMDPVAKKIQGYIPLPLNNLLVNNYPIPAYGNYRHTTIPSLKLDHNLSSTVKLAWYYSENRSYSPNADGLPAPITAATPNDSVTRTTRLNFDETITPTMLLHLGVGLMYLNQSQLSAALDQSTLGWGSNFSASQLFPQIVFGGDNARGGFTYTTSVFAPYEYFKDIKPTSNASLTWVRGNHSIKFGGEALFEGFPTHTYSRAHGVFTLSNQQTADTWQDGKAINANTGFAYASFFLGLNGTLNDGGQAVMRLGNHAFAGYIQDTWKATRKLTIDYGLRYDYVTLLREEYGRMSSVGFQTPNPIAGGRPGMVIYEATCHCQFNHNYPWALGPRLGAAYQVAPKTVIRFGAGLAYGTAPNQANLGRSSNDFLTLSPSGYGEAASLFRDGNPLGVGNRFGNPVLVWPDFTPRYPVEVAPGVRPPTSPFIHIDRNSGRPPRIFQWSFGIQRELAQNLVVEAAYVGNRGAWWTAPVLSLEDYNSLNPATLKSVWGLDITNPTDRALLTTRINSPAVIARFPWLANPNNVYPGFPATQPLNQALRPIPQFLGIPGFLGPPLGDTWYDSLQAKLTKRLSRGLSVDSAFTWQKELNLGTGADTTYLTPAPNLINDVYNRDANKQISGFSRPFILVISFRYTTPRMAANSGGQKALSWATRDWNIAGVLRYQSGEVLRTPASNNNLLNQLARGPSNNPAIWGGGTTFWNRTGQPLFNFDPNCHCFDPTQQVVLNPNAWSDAPAGTFGTSAPYYNNFRWQRQPAESLSLGRTFGLDKEARVKLDLRVEFFNVMNRLFLNSPSGVGQTTQPAGPNPAAPVVKSGGILTSGYGVVSTSTVTLPGQIPGNGSQPRTGQIVARVTF